MSHQFKIGERVKSRHDGGPSGVVENIHGDDITIIFGSPDDPVRSTFPSCNLLPADNPAKDTTS